MRKAIVMAALAAALCLLSGCDFFRVLAGRPTSKEIVAKRVRIGQELAANRRQPDSLELARQRQTVDSLAGLAAAQPAAQAPASASAPASAAPSQPARSGKTLSARNLAAAGGPALTHRYYLMIGAFGQPENARRQAERAEKAGYPATLIPFKSGVTAVGVAPTDDLNQAWAMLDRLRAESFCPKDAWILDNE